MYPLSAPVVKIAPLCSDIPIICLGFRHTDGDGASLRRIDQLRQSGLNGVSKQIGGIVGGIQ